MVYAPESAVKVSRRRPVAVSVTSIHAPAIEAPEASVTVPVRVARSACAAADAAKNASDRQNANRCFILFFPTEVRHDQTENIGVGHITVNTLRSGAGRKQGD